MKQLIYLSLFIVIFISLSACRQEKDNTETARLAQLDNLLSLHPEAVLDSLKQINPSQLSTYNKAYYQLLEIIAKDKTYYEFSSDSLINSTVDVLSTYRSKQTNNYARSLMYQGIVRYRMNITDSIAYQPLKDAKTLFQTLTPPELRNQYLCLYYLGEIHEKNNNTKLASNYYSNAVQIAKSLNDSSYLYSTYSGLFWVSMKRSDYNSAKHYLDTLSNHKMVGDEFTISFKNMQSAYFQYTEQHNNAIKIEKEILKIKDKLQLSHGSISNFYSISKSYLNVSQLDSALKYATLTVEAIQDTNYHLNYLYYHNMGLIAQKMKKWELSSTAYKKTYELMDRNIDKNIDTKLIELEKKYDLTESENTILHFKNRAIILAAILLFLVSVIIILIQHSIRQKQIKILTEQRNQALENEKLLLYEKHQIVIDKNKRNEQELIKKKLILSFFQQVSMQNLEIKNLLYDLKVNTFITKNKNIYNKISEEYDNYNRKSKITEIETFTDDFLIKLTGINHESAKLLNKSEKLMLLLISLDAGNREMSVLFNTSTESIRSRKLKLKKKLEQLNILISKNID